MKTWARWVGAGLALVALGACEASTDTRLVTASRSMSCPADRLTFQDISVNEQQLLKLASGPVTEVAMGCGKVEAFAHMCTVLEVGSEQQCDWYAVSWLKARDLRKRAAFDANCPPENLALNGIDDSTTGVLGCGQRMSYTWSCPHSSRLYSGACHWILNGASGPTPAPAGSVAAPVGAPPARVAPAARPTEI